MLWVDAGIIFTLLQLLLDDENLERTLHIRQHIYKNPFASTTYSSITLWVSLPGLHECFQDTG